MGVFLMNTFMLILLTLSSWGQGLKGLVGLSADTGVLCKETVHVADKYPWVADVRAKIMNLSVSDKEEAICFLKKNIRKDIAQKLEKFENCQVFDSIVISDKKARSLVQIMADTTSSHGVQRAILLIMLAIGTIDRSTGSFDIRKYIAHFEKEGVVIVPDNGSWALTTKRGCKWPALVVEKFM